MINFDSTSKGNPDPVGYGMILVDGTIYSCLDFAGSSGTRTNNVVELSGLEACMKFASELQYKRIHITGYSHLILDMIQRIINAYDPKKVAKICWFEAQISRIYRSL